jgi:OFA family oxalate/formate antiporter-like MFS transporter
MRLRTTGRFSRWWLVVAATVAMGMAGTYQFSWSSIRVPLGAQLGTSETALGTVFTVFIVLQSVSQFPAGWVRDRIGPRPPMAVGAVLLVTGYAGAAWASSVLIVYACYALAGVGVGTVYTVAVNTPVKWFDDRRGLATGVVGFSYAATSFLLIPLIRGNVTAQFERTLLALAALVGVLTLAVVPFIRDPPDGGDGDGAGSNATTETETDGGEPTSTAGQRDYTWREAVRTWQFWLLYAVFVVVNAVGLMVIGKVVAFAEQMTLPAAATVAASLVALGDGGGVVVGGWVSDWFGRVRTMAVTLVLCGLCLGAATLTAVDGFGLGFAAFIAAASFFRSPAFSVFPSLVGDYYGTGHSSENYALLYTSKLWGGVVGGTVTSALVVVIGWDATFLLGAGGMVVAGVATLLLRPVDPAPE